LESNIFLDRFTLLLEKKKLTRVEFSKLSGVNYNTIMGWYKDINRTKNIKLSILLDVARHLNCSIDYLVGNSDIETIKSDSNIIKEEEKELLNRYNSLDDRGQKNINRMLDMELQNKEE
jgi:transcriptional regulator with XRE-family HTH domain